MHREFQPASPMTSIQQPPMAKTQVQFSPDRSGRTSSAEDRTTQDSRTSPRDNSGAVGDRKLG